jgi:hypothetical protein
MKNISNNLYAVAAIIAIVFFVSCEKTEIEDRSVQMSTSLCVHAPEDLNYRMYRKTVYDGPVNIVSDEYFSNATTMLNFNTHYGNQSPLIYDFNGNQITDASDLATLLTGYGLEPPYRDLCEVVIDFYNSHGYPSSYPGADFALVHPTTFDEEGLVPDTLNTFWIELIYEDSTIREYYARH